MRFGVRLVCRRWLWRSEAGLVRLRALHHPRPGLKEKTLAAHRAGIKTVLVPKENKKDLKDIPKRIREKLRIVLVEYADDVLREALVLEKPDEFFRKPGQTTAASADGTKPVEEPAPAAP